MKPKFIVGFALVVSGVFSGCSGMVEETGAMDKLFNEAVVSSGRNYVGCRYALSGTNQIVEKIEAMYGFACAQTNRFNIVWQPQNPAAWPVPGLNLDEGVLVGASTFGSDLGRNEFIRLRRIEP